MAWEDKGKWVDDDGSETVGTAFTAARMNNLEALGTDLATANITLIATKAIALQASGVALGASAGAIGASAAAIAASAAVVKTQEEQAVIQTGLTLVKAATTATLGAKEVSPGRIEANANGVFAPDGVTVAVGDRVLMKNDTILNGVYQVLALGSASAKVKLERVATMREASQFKTGMQVVVALGTNYAGTTWWFTTAEAGLTLGLTTLTFARSMGKIITGTFDSAGATVTGGGFTMGHPATGQYTITFTVPFLTRPSAHATPTTGEAGASAQSSVSTTFATVYILGAGGTSLVNGGGSFTYREPV